MMTTCRLTTTSLQREPGLASINLQTTRSCVAVYVEMLHFQYLVSLL
jgi:hypothetical protein